MLKVLCSDLRERQASLRDVRIAVAAFLVEYVVVFVVSKNLVKVDLASDTDDLAAGVTAAIVVVVAFADVVFDYDYIVCVAVDVVVAGYVALFIVAVDDAGVPAAAHVDATCLCNSF